MDAYLTLVAAQETVRAAQAGVDRAEVILKTISAQVGAELRPGADQSRAEAELAAARTQSIQAEQAVDVSRATLAQFTGGDPSRLGIATGNLLELPPEKAPAADRNCRESVVVEQSAAVEQATGAVARAGTDVFSEVLSPGRGLCARLRRGNQRRSSRRTQRTWHPTYKIMRSASPSRFPILDLPAIRAR